jgi:uncharacterized protein YjiS (DUF1127 family)
MATIIAPDKFDTSETASHSDTVMQRAFAPVTNWFASLREQIIEREMLSELRELDDFMLRDIGATGDEIYRLHQMRNGQRPTLLVG